MIISERDIKDMVVECVSVILERHGAIDNKLEALAEIVIQKAQAGGGEISAEEINTINPYFKTDRPLKVSITDNDNDYATYDAGENEICVNLKNSVNILQTVMHELSHFIDISMRTKPVTPNISFDTNGSWVFQVANDILYYFRPTEIQARLTQYNTLLREYPASAKLRFSSKTVDRILKFSYMEELIEYFECCMYGKGSMQMVQAVSFAVSHMRATNRNSTSHGAFYKGMTEPEFNQQKAKISSVLKKRLNSMKQKASKLKFDALQQLN